MNEPKPDAAKGDGLIQLAAMEKDNVMALSDVLYNASVEIERGVEYCVDGSIAYDETKLEWCRRLVGLLQRAARQIKEGGELPPLPTIGTPED